MSWSEIGTLYINELRSALRERTIVINSILIPLLLYPVLLWVTFSGLAFVLGKTEGMVARVVLTSSEEGTAGEQQGDLAGHRQLLEQALQEADGVELSTIAAGDAIPAIRDGRLDLLLELQPAAEEGRALADNYQVNLTFNGAKDRSKAARSRLVRLLDDNRASSLKEHSEELQVSPEQWQQFAVETTNLASGRQLGARLMALLLPMVLIIMLALGSFYPAVDATAGERERGTWETLMSTGASRTSIVVAKYLYVATMGTVAGLLNLVSMTVSMHTIFAPLLGRSGEQLDFQFQVAALPVLAAGSVLLALFVAAGLMILASFARTFKEGQSLASPFLFLLYLPVLLLQGPDIELSLGLACVPVANVMIIFRDAITGSYNLPLIALAFAVELVTIALCMRLATAILRFEDVVIGSYEGNLFALARQRLLGRGERSGATT